MSLNPRLSDWRGRRVWLIGASTGIGRALAVALQAEGAQVLLSARKADALEALCQSLPGSQAWPLDVQDAAAVQTTARMLLSDGPLDLVCYCAGHYQPMRAWEMDLPELARHHDINVAGAQRVLSVVVPAMLERGQGHLSLISSVAGWRGLPRSLAYGPTKAALINLCETLYLDLRPRGLGVSLINPGFVRTPLTAGNEFRMPALIEPEDAAREVLKGWRQGRFDIHFPKRFTFWMRLLRYLPDAWYFASVRRMTGL